MYFHTQEFCLSYIVISIENLKIRFTFFTKAYWIFKFPYLSIAIPINCKTEFPPLKANKQQLSDLMLIIAFQYKYSQFHSFPKHPSAKKSAFVCSILESRIHMWLCLPMILISQRNRMRQKKKSGEFNGKSQLSFETLQQESGKSSVNITESQKVKSNFKGSGRNRNAVSWFFMKNLHIQPSPDNWRRDILLQVAQK